MNETKQKINIHQIKTILISELQRSSDKRNETIGGETTRQCFICLFICQKKVLVLHTSKQFGFFEL